MKKHEAKFDKAVAFRNLQQTNLNHVADKMFKVQKQKVILSGHHKIKMSSQYEKSQHFASIKYSAKQYQRVTYGKTIH